MAPASTSFDLPALAKAATPSTIVIEVLDERDDVIAVGSGFWASRDGAIVTNLHVLKGGMSVQVKSDPKNFKTPVIGFSAFSTGAPILVNDLLGFDEKWDLAILKMSAEPVNVLTLGEARKAEVGERIAVIGNPQGLERTISEGIISAKRAGDGPAPILQITAPISPGSSGSPVLNARGQVVGVATASLADSQGLNFAIPAEAVSALLAKCAGASPTSIESFARDLAKPKAAPTATVPPKAFDSEEFRRETNLLRKKAEAALFAWLKNQGLQSKVLDEIKRANITKWPRWGEMMNALKSAKDRETLKALLMPFFDASDSRDADIATSGLSAALPVTATPMPIA